MEDDGDSPPRSSSPVTSSTITAPPPFDRRNSTSSNTPGRPKSRRRKDVPDDDAAQEEMFKRKCVSSACIACRKRKSKCDGNLPACAACSSVYGTPCVYDPNSDHRRKGVYKQDIDNLKTRNSTLQTLVQAILNYPDDDLPELIREIRTCETLDSVAENIIAQGKGLGARSDSLLESPTPQSASLRQQHTASSFEAQLAEQLGRMRFDDGSCRFVGGTSHLVDLRPDDLDDINTDAIDQEASDINGDTDAVTSWTSVTTDRSLIMHLLNMYFTWHYTFFTILSKSLFLRDFYRGKPAPKAKRKAKYCSSLLVNAMLALGSHFTSNPVAREVQSDSATCGDHFFREARRLKDEDENNVPSITTVQALALMSLREAGCAREARGWYYSGMAFRMAFDLGLNYNFRDSSLEHTTEEEEEEDARRITFWGCFLFDKCWSNYLGRLPIFHATNITISKAHLNPAEEADSWTPFLDTGFVYAYEQPGRIRAVALQISALSDINGDLMRYFYHPQQYENPPSRQTELKRLSDIHARLETWRRDLPQDFEPREGTLSSVLLMHMLFQLLYIHLFRPFLKYSPKTSPLPQNVSPRKLCTQAASTISKLLRLYKRSYGLRQIPNIAIYIAHSACVIHLLNLPERNAKRDITHGFKHLEEMAEGWLSARRTIKILGLHSKRWEIELPEEASAVLLRAQERFPTTSPTSISGNPHETMQSLDTLKQITGSLTTSSAHSVSDNPVWPDDTDAQLRTTIPTWLQHVRHDSDGANAALSRVKPSVFGPQDAQFSWRAFGKKLQNGDFSVPHHPHTHTQAQAQAQAQAQLGLHGPKTAAANHSRSISSPLRWPQFPQDHATEQRPSHTSHDNDTRNWAFLRQPQNLSSSTTAADAAILAATAAGLSHTRGVNAVTASDPMFGGVDSLLRDDSGWWMAEQTQVASGFSKWLLPEQSNQIREIIGSQPTGRTQTQVQHVPQQFVDGNVDTSQRPGHDPVCPTEHGGVRLHPSSHAQSHDLQTPLEAGVGMEWDPSNALLNVPEAYHDDLWYH